MAMGKYVGVPGVKEQEVVEDEKRNRKNYTYRIKGEKRKYILRDFGLLYVEI